MIPKRNNKPSSAARKAAIHERITYDTAERNRAKLNEGNYFREKKEEEAKRKAMGKFKRNTRTV